MQVQSAKLLNHNKQCSPQTFLKVYWEDSYILGGVGNHIKASMLHPLKDQRKLLAEDP